MSEEARARILYSGADEDGNLKYWYAETLWKAAETAEVQELPLTALELLDEVVWFGGHQDLQPTVRRVAHRARDIFQADLTFPIIKIRGGEVIDGAHRVARAYLEGHSHIKVAILDDYPTPDGIISSDSPGIVTP